MSTYKSTVIKTGNSFALRVPKQYITDAGLQEGQKINLQLPVQEKVQNAETIQSILTELHAIHAFASITDPVDWQRRIRSDRRHLKTAP